jgi:hypothetical protein
MRMDDAHGKALTSDHEGQSHVVATAIVQPATAGQDPP